MEKEILEKFIIKQKSLLEIEKQAEIKEVEELQSNYPQNELQRRGVALLNLSVAALRTGLGGKCLLDLEVGFGSDKLPPHKFSNGDIVSITTPTSSKSKRKDDTEQITGVVYRVQDSKIVVAFKEEIPESLQNQISIFKIANNVSFQRMVTAIEKIDIFQPLPKCLFSTKPTFGDIDPTTIYFNPNMNESQKTAIQFCLAAREFALIHGPPGTGKTHTIVELVQQLVAKKERVLVCGPSNISVDNLVERLSKTKLEITRVGHPARILQSVLDHALEVRVRTCEEGLIVNDVRNDLDSTLKKVKKCKNRNERRTLFSDIKHLRSELKTREFQVIDTIMKNSNVVLCTLSGASSFSIKKLSQSLGPFDSVIIDESSQALEAESWVAIRKKLILVGDNQQLPPTIKSNQSALEITLFDRLIKLHGNAIKKTLNVQYRSNKVIMEFSSKELYDGKLIAHSSVKDRLLPDSTSAIVFVDTAGFDFKETEDESTSLKFASSKFNDSEALVIFDHVKKLVKTGVSEFEIAVISPYNAQVSLLKNYISPLFSKIEIGSVDGFQGREKDCILLSLVRSNEDGEVGFLADHRRMNVAITRARKHLFVVGDSETLCRGGGFLKRFMSYLEDVGEVRFPEQ